MAAFANQRPKLLYLMKILLEKTDAEHPMLMSEIIAELGSYGITAERKTIYADLELLRQFGLNIETLRSRATSYYIDHRQFELAELKLLVDAVQSSRFITEKRSNELIAKLSSLTSAPQAKHLKRQVYVAGRAKAMNETVYYSIDQIHAAINEGKQISFRYFDYSTQKKRVYRKKGEAYLTTPVTLCWSDDCYYLIAYNSKHDALTHYRVDRMSETTVLDEDAVAFESEKFNIAEHIRRVFGMYVGELIRATLSFDNSLVNVVLDHFGKDVNITAKKDGRFEVMADVSVSPVFLAWMFQFGGRAEIKAPDSLIAAMKDLISENSRLYTPMSNKTDTSENSTGK
jgi:predicted DNA-binding transcriptional regulator YafY